MLVSVGTCSRFWLIPAAHLWAREIQGNDKVSFSSLPILSAGKTSSNQQYQERPKKTLYPYPQRVLLATFPGELTEMQRG